MALVFTTLALPFSSHGLSAPDHMSPEDCSLGKLVSLAPTPKDFVLSSWGGLGASMQGIAIDAYQQVTPFMPYGSPKVFKNIDASTPLGEKIHSFLKDHPDHALQIGVFFPSIWNKTAVNPLYLLMGRSMKESDETISDLGPLIRASKRLNTLCSTQIEEQKAAIIQILQWLPENPLAMEQKFYLFQMQRMGWRVKKDLPGAIQGLQGLAEKNHAASGFCLGNMYKDGTEILQNFEAAFHYYEQAADQGHAKAQYQLSFLYQGGKGVARNPQQCLKYLQLSGDQGYSEAQAALAMPWMSRPLHPRRCLQQAFDYCKLAADQDNGDAQYALGIKYSFGQGVRKNLTAAFAQFQLAADQGHRDAQYALASLYDDGDGVPQNFKQAFRWYKAAAEQEERDAQFKLGTMYADGKGIEQNPVNAIKWYKAAATQGHAKAKIHLARLG